METTIVHPPFEAGNTDRPESDRLLRKYDIPSPRYTSYPTVPYWSDTPCDTEWKTSVARTFRNSGDEGVSLYIHLPYCESLCTYCGCNKRITINHAVERPYINAVLEEWQMYGEVLGEGIPISEVHLGGGTPTFFSPAHLKLLMDGLLKGHRVMKNRAFSFEAHPANTTPEHLETLYDCGFERLSLGIQDFDPRIQRAINRQQTWEQVRDVVSEAREIGYTSINFDLIYGLPFQTPESIRKSISMALELRPERIAFYSYAHVPWKHKGQRRYDESDLPSDAGKRQLYETGRRLFLENGYEEIGMDHFALPGDELLEAMHAGRLHRNFMGYTPRHTRLLIGLGTSAISDSTDILVQNAKTVEEYLDRIRSREIPVFRGHVLSDTDKVVRKHILSLMTRYATDWDPSGPGADILQGGIARLADCVDDGLAEVSASSIRVTEKGQPFVRIIAMALDARLHAAKSTEPQFSRSI